MWSEGTYYVIAFQRQENAPVFEARARQKVEVMGEYIDSLTISLNAGVTIQGRIRVDASSVKLDRVVLALTSVDEDGQMGGHGDVSKTGFGSNRSTTAITQSMCGGSTATHT